VQGQAEIAWTRLGPGRRRKVSRKAIQEDVERQVARLRADTGFPNQAFVARTRDGIPSGYVWVARTHNDSTGEMEASLLSQYVTESYRGQGLGTRLMETAEDWARQQGLPRISLSVGVRNRLGQRLYESLGYEMETMRMSKRLVEGESEELRLAMD
jgi:ribosomal protein S18 acetylase RimI-like enzyme